MRVLLSRGRIAPKAVSMKLFLSYPSAQRPLAEQLALALEAEGHDVFIDRADLKAGEAFHQRLRESIQQADAFVFLVTPASVAAGSYALAELNFAQQRWRRPGGHVLPVMVEPTPIEALPHYLSAVTVLQPRGDAVAETVAAVAQLTRPSGRRRKQVMAATVAILLVSAAVGVAVSRHAEQRAAEQALLEARRTAVSEAASARQLCDDGSHAPAFTALNELATHMPLHAVLDAREDCAMRWLREMRAIAGKQTFDEQVAVVQPVLLSGVSRASGQRAADLRSHIGWGEYLRGREGAAAADPVAHWRRALADDAGNVYAHAMWGRLLLDAPKGLDEARRHFRKATDTVRDRAFVRALQLGGALGGGSNLAAYAVTVADEMRRAGEPASESDRSRLWSYAFNNRLLFAEDRATMTAALPPADLLATFTWLFPPESVGEDRRPMWRFIHATLLAHNGQGDAARVEFESLARELRAAKRVGRLLDEAERALGRGAPAPRAR